MSKTRVKTTYEEIGPYGAIDTFELYCNHNHSTDFTVFLNEKGEYADLSCFSDDGTLWEAMQKLWYPFKDKWGGELKDGVEYYTLGPWEKETING